MSVTGMAELAQAGGSHTERAGGNVNQATAAAKAWISCCEAEGSGAREIGAVGVLGLTQHAGVAQCLLSHPVQQQLLATPESETAMAGALITLCHARRNPSNTTIAAFVIFRAMTYLSRPKMPFLAQPATFEGWRE